MAQNKACCGKVQRRGGGGGEGGGWRRGRRRGSARGGSGSDDPSDEEYVVGLDEEGESSYDSYSSDASREASVDTINGASCSEEEEEELEPEDVEEVGAAGGRCRRLVLRNSRVKRGPREDRNSKVSFVPEEESEMETPPARKARPVPRQRSAVFPEEEEESEDDDDEDFAPDEEEEEEELVKSPVRKAGGGKSGPLKKKQQQNKTRPGNWNYNVNDKRKKAPARKRNMRIVVISDDDDPVVEDKVQEDGEQMKNKRARICRQRRRKSRVIHSDSSDSDSSDVDFKIDEEELGDLQAEGPLDWERRPLSSGVHGQKKGKGKELDDLAQICGICLSEEKKEAIRGLLDCCSHFFCFACIMEWSKVESRCPVCKRRFKTVSKSVRSDAGFSLRTTVVKIPKRDQVYQPSEEEIRGFLDPYANVVCVECQQGGDDNLMLLCDLCDSPAHTYCVGLGREVPEGNWYCNGCRSTDPAPSNYRAQASFVNHGSSGEPCWGNTSVSAPQEPPQQLAALTCQIPSEGAAYWSSDGRPSPGMDPGTPSRASGIMASTLLGRRSIHQRIRFMLFNDRSRRTPEGLARNPVNQPSCTEDDAFGSEMEQHGNAICASGHMNGRDGSSSRSLLGSRGNVNLWPYSEGGSLGALESAKDHVQS